MNILVTPNVIINCILTSAPRQKEACRYFLEQILILQRENEISIFMTSVDKLIVYSYLHIIRNLEINDNQPILNLLITYINNIEEYPIYQTTVDQASEFQINPSDALRLAVALSPEIEIMAIVTWEPSHFTQRVSDTILVQNNGSGNIWVADSYEVIDELNYDEIETEISSGFKRKPITKYVYSPNEFIRHFEDLSISDAESDNTELNQHKLSLSSLEVNSTPQESQAEVIIEYEYNNSREFLPTETFTTSGPVSAILGAIHISTARMIKNRLPEKAKQADIIKNLIFSVTPIKEQNNEVLVNLGHINTDIMSRVKSKNILYAAGEAYIEIINCIINSDI